jgi:hypothetical protein
MALEEARKRSAGSRDARFRLVAATALVIGAVLGMGGTFAPSAGLRALAWGLDGTALIVAASLLTIHYFRRGNDAAAAGFLVFAVGEGVIVSTAAMDLEASAPSFAAGASLWAAALAIVSASGAMPSVVSGVGFIGSLLFTVVAVQIFLGYAVTALSQPLPFFAYPFLAATLLGWAWVHYRQPD